MNRNILWGTITPRKKYFLFYYQSIINSYVLSIIKEFWGAKPEMGLF